ncbi:hypothetical protein K8Z61_00500 [Nocardioides sp. TRM66260-LWL]|uniref:hypothetical protein n=1 Tax=Nocardioides sp. TRM66260-LWL TaxID=2874478 RepID=UPI001CC681A5|nr:hypothetical protein [Nocardioides sp. TRM66260-LWL]MBZ5732966.1 hypothetical protein [Nocardioides sp. TRM66260-LWL]
MTTTSAHPARFLRGRLRLVGGVQHVAGDTPPTSFSAARPGTRPMLLTPYAATALESPSATVAARHSRSGLQRRLRVGQQVVLVDRRGGQHDGVVEDIAYTEDDVVYLLGPERRGRRRPTSLPTPTATPGPSRRTTALLARTAPDTDRDARSASVLDLELARRRRAAREDGAVR